MYVYLMMLVVIINAVIKIINIITSYISISIQRKSETSSSSSTTTLPSFKGIKKLSFQSLKLVKSIQELINLGIITAEKRPNSKTRMKIKAKRLQIK